MFVFNRSAAAVLLPLALLLAVVLWSNTADVGGRPAARVADTNRQGDGENVSGPAPLTASNQQPAAEH
jgi:hypothetical protein